MKRAIFVSAVCGFALVCANFVWAAGNAGGPHEPNDITVEVQPAPLGPASPNLPQPSAGSGGSDVRAIEEAIDRFKFFFEGQDADLLKKAIWPSMSSRQYSAMKRAFDAVSQVTLLESCPGSPAIAGDSAEWTCTEMLESYVGRETRPSWQSHLVQFRLKKLDGAWYVDGRSGKWKKP